MPTGSASTRPRSPTLALLAAAFLLLAACHGADPGYKGRASSDWIAQLGDSAAARRLDAAFALRQVLIINPGYTPAIRALVRAVGDSVDEVRVAAATALTADGVRAPRAIPELAGLLGDTAHVSVRMTATRVLGTLLHRVAGARGRASAEDANALRAGTDALLTALRDPDAAIRAEAALSLGPLARRSPALAPEIRTALVSGTRDIEDSVRLAAVEALAVSRAPAPMLLPVDRAALGDVSAAVRVAAAAALGGLGDSAAPALPDLAAALRDSASRVRTSAAVAIGLIGPAPVARELRLALRDPDPAVRREAAHALDAYHQRGGEDPASREPTAQERCKASGDRLRC